MAQSGISTYSTSWVRYSKSMRAVALDQTGLGLKLESAKVRVEVFVVDYAE